MDKERPDPDKILRDIEREEEKQWQTEDIFRICCGSRENLYHAESCS